MNFITINIAKLTFGILFLSSGLTSLHAQDSTHKLENMHVTIQATDYKHSKFVEHETIKRKEYIFGKATSYKKNGEANAGIMLQPYADYVIKSNMAGGSYNVTIHYQIDKETAPKNPMLAIAIDAQKPQYIEIKNKLVNTVKANFKVKFIKGKSHTIRVWFPSQGVKINELKINKALVNKKS